MEPTEIKYLAEQIKKTISAVDHNHFQMIMNVSEPGEREEYPGWQESWIKSRIKDLYYLILAYLEAKNMVHFLETFKTKFQPIMADDKKIMEDSFYDPEAGVPELNIIYDFKQFLDVFQTFDYQQTREDELVRLKKILRDTDHILKNSNADIYNETDIYKQVKWVLGMYYPSCRGLNKASFIAAFKSYHPDILIPELKVAIEYKYIKDKTDNIDEFIDQIRSDATNYTGDSRYENFIAVIYLENTSITREDSIQEAWKAKKFPKEWNLVVAPGSPTKKSVTGNSKKTALSKSTKRG